MTKMNIFVLSEDPAECAKLHCDKHVVKMVLETAQMLCTAISEFTGGEVLTPYKATHKKHPCVLWAMESIENFLWLAQLGLELSAEYTHRYGKVHKSSEVIHWALENCPRFPHVPMTEFVMCMPDEFKEGRTVVEAYKRYYRDKAYTINMCYSKREAPNFLRGVVQ
jgi:hypothetical protein